MHRPRPPLNGRNAAGAMTFLAALAAAVLVVAGCGSSGRELRPPAGLVATEIRFVPVNQSQGPGGMLVEGTDFEPGGELPAALVAGGGPPTLAWWNIPAGTTELVLLVSTFDPSEPPLLWAVGGLGPSSAGLLGDGLPLGVSPLVRTGGGSDWPGYPPAGTRVVFTLCALASPLPENTGAGTAWDTCHSGSLGLATVSALVPAAQP